MSDSSISEPRLKTVTQKIGWITASVLVSSIIGGGIFTTTGLMARNVGDPPLILLLWLVGALFVLGGAMVYGELGVALPHAGGKTTDGISQWMDLLYDRLRGGGSGLIYQFSSNALRVVPIEDKQGWIAKGLSLALLWIATLMHCRSVEAGGRLQLLLTTTKVVAILESRNSHDLSRTARLLGHGV